MNVSIREYAYSIKCGFRYEEELFHFGHAERFNRYLIQKKTAKKIFLWGVVGTRWIERGKPEKATREPRFTVDREAFESGKQISVKRVFEIIFNHDVMLKKKAEFENCRLDYPLLDLPEIFTRDDVKKAYREGCKKHHPDHGGDQVVFVSLNKEYEKAMANII